MRGRLGNMFAVMQVVEDGICTKSRSYQKLSNHREHHISFYIAGADTRHLYEVEDYLPILRAYLILLCSNSS